MVRGALPATVHGVAKSQTRLTQQQACTRYKELHGKNEFVLITEMDVAHHGHAG